MGCQGICEKSNFWFFKNFYEGNPKETCMKAITDEFKDSRGYLGYSIGLMSLLSLLILFSLCGICRSKDRCFQKSRLDGQDPLVEDSILDPVFISKGDISAAEAHAGTGSAGNIEMPDRAKRYQIRQRNYDID